MHLFTCNHPHSIKRSWKTGNLRRIGNFAWGSFLWGVGEEFDEQFFWQFVPFVMLKSGWGNKTVVGGEGGV